ncbi:EAL domain-containing protein [Polymorphospora rubra]|uniref:EAL domain-containing protein n=1 Tax=Polymorphospora rubra TaxID=338584 RepID=UPI00340C4301
MAPGPYPPVPARPGAGPTAGPGSDTGTATGSPATTGPLRDLLATRLAHGHRDFTLAYCAVAGFGEILDTLGPAAAGRLVDRVGRELATALRPAETCTPLPGGFFALLLAGAPPATTGHRLADLVRRASGWTPDVYGQVTAGAAAADGAAGADDLAAHAGLALAEANRRGPGSVALFEPRLFTAARARVDLERDLRRAVEADRITVHYQPVHDLTDGAVVGYEALARWSDPDRGQVSPAEFIPAAERAGLIDDLGMTVLRQALTDLRRYGVPRDRWLSVNVSPLQLDDDFARRLLVTVDRAGVPADRLRVEITESAMLRSTSGYTQLDEIRRRGVRVLVDDFGIGYSSLASLRRLPVDGIKIARELLHDGVPAPADTTVVRAVRLLAAGAGITEIIAEGVENAAEARTLAALGVPYGQGFHLGRPAPAARALRPPGPTPVGRVPVA